MEITFEKVGNKYVAEFEATADFNIHIERVKEGTLEMFQTTVKDSQYDFFYSPGVKVRKIMDLDVVGAIYPKYIKISSGSEVTNCVITCPDGEVAQIVASKYEFVDLGLPSGTKWATCNVGAKSPEETGLFFQWGDTQGYKVISYDVIDENEGVYSIKTMEPEMKQFAGDFSDYKFYNSESGGSFTKYNELDGLTTLELIDDAANADYSKMRMPTKEEYEELLAETTSAWTDNYNGTNVKGCIFTSKVDETKSIFVPAATAIIDAFIEGQGIFANLWSSSLCTSIVIDSYDCAYRLDSISNASAIGNNPRYFGIPVRGVLID